MRNAPLGRRTTVVVKPNLPRPTDYLLMREELGIVRRDAIFERTLARAARLAESGKS